MAAEQSIIQVEGVSKRYRIGLKENQATTFSEKILAGLKTPLNNFRRLSRMGKFVEDDESTFWALRDINFNVNRGEVLGIIGRNGAGKSTLLKVLSRITEPSTGVVTLGGRVASLLEVGTGFHPELTGRENVYMNGTILGMRRQEIDAKFDEIVDFSGIENFIDTPIKFYSSGMKVRLGFAVAANLDPEILIVDEVLAVGDFEFQQKCLGKMGEVAHKEGRTIIFVSHSIPAIKSLCTTGLLLESGKVKFQGNIDETVVAYLKNSGQQEGVFMSGKDQSWERVIVRSVEIQNQHNENTELFNTGDDLTVKLCLEALEDFDHPHLGVVIKSGTHAISVANTMIDGAFTGKLRKGRNDVSCTFRRLPLLPREYHVSLLMRDNDAKTQLTSSKDIGFFSIVTRMKQLGNSAHYADMIAADSVSPLIPYTWTFSDGHTSSFDILENAKPLRQ